MSIPGHNPDCESYIFKMRCPDCGKFVWFLGCSCGSKVFFDEKGPPWPHHSETCWKYQIRLLFQDGASAKHIRDLLLAEARKRGETIPPDIEAYLQKMGAGGKVIFYDVLPSIKGIEISGILRELREINFYKRLELTHNYFIEKILGKFSKNDYYEIIVQSNEIPNSKFVNRYTFLILSSEISGGNLKPGDQITASIKGERIFEDVMMWVASEIDWK